METIQAFGRQAIEAEIEANNPEEQGEDTALQVSWNGVASQLILSV